MRSITLEKDHSVILHPDGVEFENHPEHGYGIQLDVNELNEAEERLQVCQMNAKEVILSTVHIESLIAEALADYFSFGDRKPLIQKLIFESDSFSVAAKLKAFRGIVTAEEKHKGNDWKVFEDSIRRVIRYRNMFCLLYTSPSPRDRG